DLDVKPGLLHSSIDPAAGCSQPAIGLHVATDAELFGRVRRPSRGRSVARTRTEDMTREFTLDFAPDELVVHVDHGIARFKGMRLIESEGAHREYLELEYAEGDRLFVPVENLDRVQKYLGGEAAPALHRLGTSDWTRARGRARKRVQDVADELLKMYSMREAGRAAGPDHRARAAALPRVPGAVEELPSRGRDAVAIRRRRDAGADSGRTQERPCRHRRRHASPAPARRPLQATGTACRRRGAPLRRHAKREAEEVAHAARRALAVGAADSAHAAHGRGRDPRHERDPDAAGGA